MIGNLVIYAHLHIFRYADFLLIVEELLIDFRDIIGEHSGANMAHAVYETLCSFGLKGRVSRQILFTMALLFIACTDHGYQQRQCN